jgi:precorrin-2 dehydrogenase/sirohydrochlorin ferrochelatase
MDVYPVNLVLQGRPALVVGGGRVALAKAKGLVAAGALVTVVAPEVDDELAALPGVTAERRPYRRGEVGAYRFVVAATDDSDVNGAVFADGETAGVFVNAADDPVHCSATLPARLDRGRLLVTVSTGGATPAVASWVRDRIGQQLGSEFEALVDLVAEVRAEVRAGGATTEGLGWRHALDSGMLDLIREGRLAEAKELLRACLSSS